MSLRVNRPAGDFGRHRIMTVVLAALVIAGCGGDGATTDPLTPAPPAAPTDLVATSGNGSVSLTWTASVGATSYTIWQAVSGVGLGSVPTATGVTATEYTDTQVTTGTLYVFWVQAVNAGAASPLSTTAMATAGPPPAAPTGFSATAGNGSVSLAWNASAAANGYNVKRGTVSGGPYATALATTNPPNTNFTDVTGTNGTTYFYVVTAVNGAGESANSSQVSATPIAPPAAPTGLVATSGNSAVSLVWNASVGAASYTIWRAVSGVPLGSVPFVTLVTATNYTDTQAITGTLYVYWVHAENAAGASPLSTQAQAVAGPPPAAPTGLTATAGNASVALTWNASTGATSYNVKRGTVSGGPYPTAVTTTNPPNTTFTDVTATNGTTYFYIVTAVNGAGESANSIQATATPIAPPVAPTGLAATSANGSVSLSWNAAPGAASYSIYRTVSGAQFVTVPIVTGLTSTTYGDTQATVGTTYAYWVQAVNIGGTSPLSGAVTILVVP